MYHSISKIEERKHILSLDVDIFERQMDFLAKHNYKVVSLKTAAYLTEEKRRIPHNYVVLTFDDGYKDFYVQAYPVLKRYNCNFTLFVIVNDIENDGMCLSWGDIRQLGQDKLADIGSHSLFHLPLTLLSGSQVREELLVSKSILEEKIKKEVVLFAYPYGAVGDSVEKIVKESGYKAAVGTAYKKGAIKDGDIYCLKRIFVSKIARYPFVFRFMISGYYIPTREWLLRVLNIETPRDLKELKHIYIR